MVSHKLDKVISLRSIGNKYFVSSLNGIQKINSWMFSDVHSIFSGSSSNGDRVESVSIKYHDKYQYFPVLFSLSSIIVANHGRPIHNNKVPG